MGDGEIDYSQFGKPVLLGLAARGETGGIPLRSGVTIARQYSLSGPHPRDARAARNSFAAFQSVLSHERLSPVGLASASLTSRIVRSLSIPVGPYQRM